jgi:hypothetical protein
MNNAYKNKSGQTTPYQNPVQPLFLDVSHPNAYFIVDILNLRWRQANKSVHHFQRMPKINCPLNNNGHHLSTASKRIFSAPGCTRTNYKVHFIFIEVPLKNHFFA